MLPDPVQLDLKVRADHAILWRQGRLYLLDQRVLPQQVQFIPCRDAEQTAAAIKAMVVRGAPAIGITAAYGVVLAARQHWQAAGEQWQKSIAADLNLLAQSRPTAVNLFWALQRMGELVADLPADQNPEAALLQEAKRIHAEDAAMNRRMGEFGADLIKKNSSIITHCNAGALATGGYGTALGVVRAAHEQGKLKQVYADETRPWLQGSRLTVWELIQDRIPVCLLADSAAASLLRTGEVDWVIVGADRIAANGDVANKIGTYSLALAAKAHGVKFMVAAPTSTIDWNCPDGSNIPIETRAEDELLQLGDQRIAAAGCQAWNPVFDITPAHLIDAIVTEKGAVAPKKLSHLG